MSDFTGRWFTTFGTMELKQEANDVRGTYGSAGSLEGSVTGDRLTFHYAEPAETGEGWFVLSRHGKFAGEYLPHGAFQGHTWEGQRDFDGIWESSFGRLRLIQNEDGVVGYYEGVGPATLQGRLEHGRLVFHYQEPQAHGQGWFELNSDGLGFGGQWRPDSQEIWQPWAGRRVLPMPGLTWLVVLEAHWQRSLADNEYAFGHMLREFFARLPNVKVRQRFFHDEASLQHWCRELLYLPEPAILMIASHGTPEGLSVHGKTIDTAKVLDSLQFADNVKLLHFSSCLVMQEKVVPIGDKTAFPISGYTTSVDWGGSALIEFTYLDMILAKHLTPAQAAEKLPQLLAFAGDEQDAESPYAAAGFRFFMPGQEREDVIMWAGM
jgi:hypothetical protein